MIRFFSTLQQLEHFVRALRWQNHSTFICPHCSSCDQWFSHGFQYKQLSIDSQTIAGKRVICSNRYGHSGCGHTFRLYLSTRIPHLHYGCTHFFSFILALCFNNACSRCTVEQAYQLATGANNPRHAWRWLAKLRSQLPLFRSLFFDRPAVVVNNTFTASTDGTEHTDNSQSLLKISVSQLSQQLHCDTNTHNLCAVFQHQTQNRFV